MQSSLPPEIRQLPVPDRVHLAQQIWDSIAEDEQAIELSDAQKAELDRRLAADEADPGRGSSWHEVKKRLLGEL
jgi:putative addiction module component (TIGR02574 family)